jgi:plastocyanin
MKGVRALVSGMLVLAAICVIPAVSAAQDSGMPADTTTTATTSDPATPPPDTGSPPPSQPDKKPADSGNDQAAPQTLAETPDPPATTTVSAPVRAAHKASSTSVNIGDFFFSPGTVTVDVGETVTWHNSGQAPHNATASDGSFKTPDLNNGQSGSHTFSSAGTFSYICTIHPNMHGTVRVLSASGGGGGGGASSNSSGTSESSAVASPDAAGNSTTLPMTGLAVGALALTGLALLASGLLTRWAGSARRWLSLF